MMIDVEQGKRQEKRDSLLLSAAVRVEGSDRIVTVRVRNLSAGGMMIDGDAAFVPDVRIVADMRGVGEIPGRIAWAAAGRAGVAFDAEIDPRQSRSAGSPKFETPSYAKPVPGRRPGLQIR